MLPTTIRWLLTAWRVFASLCALAVVASGIGYAILYAGAGNGPVVTRIGPVRDISERVPLGGMIRFTVTLMRHESCPGRRVIVLRPEPQTQPQSFVTLHVGMQPVSLVPGEGRFNVQMAVPPGVYPGRWRLTSRVESQCPTRTHIDQIADFEFEVVP